MRASRGATVGVVAKGVDVHATLGTGILAGDVPGDLGRGRLGVLLEHHGSGDLRVTSDDADWKTWQGLAATAPNELSIADQNKAVRAKSRAQSVDICHA